MSWLKKRAEEAAKGGRCSYVHCGIEDWPICEHCAKEAALIQVIAREFAERAVEAAVVARGNGHTSDFIEAADKDDRDQDKIAPRSLSRLSRVFSGEKW